MKKQSPKFYFTIFYCLSSIFFFNLVLIPESLVYYINYGLFFLSLFIILKDYKKSYDNEFTLPIFLVILAQTFGALNATASWSQSIPSSLLGVLPDMGAYLVFFLLVLFKFDKHEIEKVILVLAFIYIIVFLFSFVIYPKIYFGKTDENALGRGFQRLGINGIGFLFLLSFYSLNKYITLKKLLWLLVFLLCIVCTIMSLTRTYIVFLVLFSAIFILRKSSNTVKFTSVIIAFVLFQVVTRMDFYKILMDQTNSQVSDANDDIRLRSTIYYLTKFPPNFISRILGNGQAYIHTSYSSFVDYLETDRGFFESDIGYVGFYTKYGALSIIAYLILIYKTFKSPANDEFLFSKYFLSFIFTISVIIDAPFNTSFIPSIVIAAYSCVLAKKDVKYKLLEKQL